MSFAPIQLLESYQAPYVWTSLDDGEDKFVAQAWYLGPISTLPTARIFSESCVLIHKAENQVYINLNAAGVTPSWKPLSSYDQWQEDGVDVPNRPIANFTYGFDLTDDPINDATIVAVDEGELDLALMGGLLDLSTQVTGTLDSSNIDLSSLTGNVAVVTDGITILGDGTAGNPLTAIGGGGGGVIGDLVINQTPDNGTYILLVGAVNGTNKVFNVSTGTYVSGSLLVYLNGIALEQGATEDWFETDPSTGEFEFVTAPAPGDIITVSFQSTSGSTLQLGIEFQDEGTPLGTIGTVNELDFVGAGVTASRIGNKVTVNVPGGSGGGTSVSLTAGENITAGDTVGYASVIDDTVFKAAWAQRTATSSSLTNSPQTIYSICEIDTDKYVIAYDDTTPSSGAYRTIVAEFDRDTNTWSFGPRSNSFGIIASGNVALVKLDTDKFALARFTQTTNPYRIRVHVCTVSGTSISIGGDATFSEPSTDNGSYVSLTQLDTDRFAMLITGTQAGSHCDLFEVTVSGTTPSIGSQNVIVSSGTSVGLITKTDTDKVVFMYNTSVWCATVSSGTWTVGTPETLTPGTSTAFRQLGIKSISPSSVFILTSAGTTSVTVKEFSITGTTLAQVATATRVCGSTASTYLATLSTDGTDIFTVIQGGVTGSNGVSKISVSGGDVVFSPFISFSVGSDFTETRVFPDQNVFEGTTYFGFINNEDPTPGDTTLTLNYYAQGMTPYFIGIAQQTVSRGVNVDVLVGGVDTNQTGLTVGTLYDPFEGGIVTTTSQSFNTLQAQSSTDILI